MPSCPTETGAAVEFSELWELGEPCAGLRDAEALGDARDLPEASSGEPWGAGRFRGAAGGSLRGELGTPEGDGLLDAAASES